jgi:hypothetical protein
MGAPVGFAGVGAEAGAAGGSPFPPAAPPGASVERAQADTSSNAVQQTSERLIGG